MKIIEYLVHNAVENLLRIELKSMKMHVQKLIRNEKCFKSQNIDYLMKFSKLNLKLTPNHLKSLKFQQFKMNLSLKKQNRTCQNGKSNLNLYNK